MSSSDARERPHTLHCRHPSRRRDRQQRVGQRQQGALGADTVGAHWVGDVLHLLLAPVLEARADLAFNCVANRFRNRDAAGFGKRLQPGRDVHAVAIDSAISLLDHIAHVHANSKMHAAVFGDVGRRIGQLPLHCERCLDGSGGSVEYRQHGVAGGVDYKPTMHCNMFSEHGASAIQRSNGGYIVKRHETRIASRVGSQDSQQATTQVGSIHACILAERPSRMCCIKHSESSIPTGCFNDAQVVH